MITIDVESAGLTGPIVLLQYAKDDGEVNLYCPWQNQINDTILLFEEFANHKEGLLFFNACFDWFHICQMYTTLLLMHDKEAWLEDCLEEYVENEAISMDGLCLKPVTACDIFLWARKTKYQSTMDRKDIVIRKVPTVLSYHLAKELEKRIPLKNVYFARRKNKNAPKWQVCDKKDVFGDIDPDWRDIKVKFAPSSALKALAVDAGIAKEEDVLRFGDISPKLYPVEFGYAPYAKAAMRIKMANKAKEKKRSGKWRNTWPEVIHHHIEHWGYNKLARQYAADDVKYTRALWQHLGCPEFGDDDSVLACLVGAARWKGYKIDIEKMKELRKKVLERRYKIVGSEKWPIPTAPNDVKKYITSAMEEVERISWQENAGGATKRVVLEKIAEWTITCPKCKNDPGDVICDHCSGKGKVRHQAAIRAEEVLNARKSGKEREIYDKLIDAGRFFASFKIIGALSSRMSGADGLNPQGIKKPMRAAFPFAFEGEDLDGGDFAGYEVTLGEACYNDPLLRKDLLTCESCEGDMVFVKDPTPAELWLQNCDPEAIDIRIKEAQKVLTRKKKPFKTKEQLLKEFKSETYQTDFICTRCGSNEGKKIHALFGINVYPHMTYDEIKATDGTENDIYTQCKRAVFAMMYGGEGPTLQDRLGVPLEIANEAFQRFIRRYKNVGLERQKIINMFQSMKQPGGIGSKVEWREPAELIKTMFGFPRYFTLENRICKELFTLANNIPPAWREMKVKVQRRDRIQTAGGAVSSALYAAAFAVQAANTRAAVNHVIQGGGAQATKKLQRAIWDLQPSGVHPWIVRPANFHDAIECPTDPKYTPKVTEVVRDVVEELRKSVPLIKMPWSERKENWASK